MISLTVCVIFSSPGRDFVFEIAHPAHDSKRKDDHTHRINTTVLYETRKKKYSQMLTCIETTQPVGMWVMRTALSVVFTL